MYRSHYTTTMYPVGHLCLCVSSIFNINNTPEETPGFNTTLLGATLVYSKAETWLWTGTEQTDHTPLGNTPDVHHYIQISQKIPTKKTLSEKNIEIHTNVWSAFLLKYYWCLGVIFKPTINTEKNRWIISNLK